MNKKVAYTDLMGFLQVGELQEFEIDRFFDDDHPDSSGRRGYGFARLVGQPRGTRGIFLPAANGHNWMRAYGIKKLEFVPQFFDSPQSHDDPGPLNEPKQSVRIVGVTGEGRKGTEIVAWSYPSSYERALKSCKAHLELELERLERDPNFKCIEISRVVGSNRSSSPRLIFLGTKSQFEKRYPLGSFVRIAGRSDPLLSDMIGDTEYTRWFEREMRGDDEWTPSKDPRQMKFMLTRTQARLLLRDSKRFEGTGVVYWQAALFGELDDVATASITPTGKKVFFDGNHLYQNTIFEGEAAEDLWKIGTPDEFETAPDTSKPTPQIFDGITVAELAARLGVSRMTILAQLLNRRIMCTVNSRLSLDMAKSLKEGRWRI